MVAAVKRLSTYLKGYWRWTLSTPVFVVIDTVCELVIVYLMSNVIDKGIQNGDLAFAQRTGLIMLALSVVSAFCGSMGVYCSAKASQGLGANLRSDLFSKVLSLPLGKIDSFSSASLITRLTGDINNIQNAFILAIRMMIRIPVMVSVSLIMTFAISARLAMLLVVVLPALFWGLKRLIEHCSELFKTVQQRLDILNGQAQENLNAARVIRAFCREIQARRRFAEANDQLTDSSIQAVMRSFLIHPLVSVSLSFVTVAVILRGATMVEKGSIQLGEVYVFLTFLTIIITNLSSIASMLTNMVRAKASSQRVLEVLDAESQSFAPPSSPRPASAVVELRDLSFRYSEQGGDVISHLSFSMAPGSFTALVGATGSGKSTIANLLCNFYTASAGRILLFGRDIRSIPPEELKQRVAAVQQECVLFSGTIRENLLWGKKDASDDALWAALRIAQAEQFVGAMPEGLDTLVRQGGLNFSGGQRQRLCIARALVAQPDLLILDDAASAVDVHTERLILAGLQSLPSRPAVLVITHRITALPREWQVILLENGAVGQAGTHLDLVRQDGPYQRLFEMQKGGAL